MTGREVGKSGTVDGLGRTRPKARGAEPLLSTSERSRRSPSPASEMVSRPRERSEGNCTVGECGISLHQRSYPGRPISPSQEQNLPCSSTVASGTAAQFTERFRSTTATGGWRSWSTTACETHGRMERSQIWAGGQSIFGNMRALRLLPRGSSLFGVRGPDAR